MVSQLLWQHHCWNTPPTTSLRSHPLFGLYKHSSSVNEYQWMQYISHGGVQWHTFVSYAPPCQTLLCQRASLLSSVTQQQNIIFMRRFNLYCYTTNICLWLMDQHSKIGGTIFGAALFYESPTGVLLRSLLLIASCLSVSETWEHLSALCSVPDPHSLVLSGDHKNLSNHSRQVVESFGCSFSYQSC